MRRLLLAALAWATVAPPVAAQWPDAPLREYEIDERTILGIVRIDSLVMDALLIIRDETIVWSQTGWRFLVEEADIPGVPRGSDVTGDGRPDLLVVEWTGGAHCCAIFHLFALDPEVRLLASLDTADVGAAFADLDGAPGLEMETADPGWAYWYTSFADSPAPRVVLRWSDETGWTPALDLMVAPAPSDEDLAAQAATVAASDRWGGGDFEPELWRVMLDLIYTGHGDLAWSFFDAAWPAGQGGKEAFARDFRCQLAAGPWWPALAAMNGLDAPSGCPAQS